MLVITIDPTNTITHLKDIVFVLLVGYNIALFKPDFRLLPQFLCIVCPVFIGYVFAEMQMNNVGNDELFAAFKSIAPFILIFWARYYNIVKLSIFPMIIAALTMFVLYLVVVYVPDVEYLVYLFSKKHNEMLMLTSRNFYGIKIFGIYCNSLYCILFAMVTLYYNFLFKNKRRVLNIIGAVIVSFPFIVGGTRSIMLLPFIIFGFAAYQRFSEMRYVKYAAYPVIGMCALMFLFVLYMLATESGQASNDMKYGHIVSYMELFSDHPEYLILGQGPGTSFYSIGFSRMTVQTEWSYIELLRNYGLSCVLIIAAFVYPVYVMFKNRKNKFVSIAMFAYVMYLFIAGTNPLLMTSTGSFVFLCAYSVMCRCVEDNKDSYAPSVVKEEK